MGRGVHEDDEVDQPQVASAGDQNLGGRIYPQPVPLPWVSQALLAEGSDAGSLRSGVVAFDGRHDGQPDGDRGKPPPVEAGGRQVRPPS